MARDGDLATGGHASRSILEPRETLGTEALHIGSSFEAMIRRSRSARRRERLCVGSAHDPLPEPAPGMVRREVHEESSR
jgi:hypothetical protein